MNAEEWRPVVGWEIFYEISGSGQLRSLDRVFVIQMPNRSLDGVERFFRGQVVKPYVRADGYPAVTLCGGGKRKRVYIHILVAAAFIGPRPSGFEVDHIDGDSTNPSQFNLRYVTHVDNEKNKKRLNRHIYGENSKRSTLKEWQVLEIRERYICRHPSRNSKSLARHYGVTPVTIMRAVHGESWAHLPVAKPRAAAR